MSVSFRQKTQWVRLAAVCALVLALSGCMPARDAAEPGVSSMPQVNAGQADVESDLPQSANPNAQQAAETLLPLANGEFNPLTGGDWPEGLPVGTRPVAVVVANTARSMPQRGLAAADVLVEMPTTDDPTRLLALYADPRNVPHVGPVSATYDPFVQFALPLDAIQMHIGADVYASNLLSLTATQDLDGRYMGKTAYWFNVERTLPRLSGMLHEYCWFTDRDYIAIGTETAQLRTTGDIRSLFSFSAKAPQGSDRAENITVQYAADAISGFAFDAAAGHYTKTHSGSEPHMDEDGTVLAFTNVIVLQTDITQKADSTALEYNFSGGKGYYFTGGSVKRITWQKGGPKEALHLLDEDGLELQVQPGKSYIGFVPAAQENAVAW